MTIFLIRHAEKPEGQIQGVNEQGSNDPESIIPRGWQRAGALAAFFVSKDGLPAPDQIYVSAAGKEKVAPHVKVGTRSTRPLETVTPLAAKLNLVPDETFTKGDEAALVDAIVKLEGTTLVCWQHESIPQIAQLIMGTQVGIPETWPGDRFDVVWIFSCPEAGQPWTFGQACQRLLAGDGSDPIS